MLNLVREHLEANKNRLKEIAGETDIPFGTLKKIHYGDTKNPGVNTIQLLYDYFTSAKRK